MTDRRQKPPRASRAARAVVETSAGGVVYRVEEGRPLFLLIRDSYRNWGFPKGHLEVDEQPSAAAIREVEEETGLASLCLDGEIDTIDWYFRFRGRLVHKTCHFFLMHTDCTRTKPQRSEGITACRWVPFDEARRLVSYTNAREVLARANAMANGSNVSNGMGATPHAMPHMMASAVAAPSATPVDGGASAVDSPEAARA